MMKWNPSKKFEAKITVHELRGLLISSPNLQDSSRFSVEIKWKGSKGIGLSSLRTKVRRNFTKEELLREDGVVQWDDEFKCVCSFSPYKDGLFHPWEVSFAVLNVSKQGTSNNIPVIATTSLNLSDLASAAEKQNREINIPLAITCSSIDNSISLRLSVTLLELWNAEEPSDSVKEKSPLKLTPSMLSGQALRSMEDVDSSKLPLDVHDDYKVEVMTNATLPDARDSSFQKQGKVEENGPKESVAPSDTRNPIKSNDSAVSLKTSSPSTKANDSVIKNDASQLPQRKIAFRMSVQEDFLEQDDDVKCNGLASRPFSENKGQTETLLTDSKLSPAEEPKLVQPSIQPEDKSPSGLILRKTGELSSPVSSAITVGEGSSAIAFTASEETTAALHSAVLPLSVAPFDKPKESNNLPSLFSFSSKVADKFPSSPSESSKKAESKLESSSSLLNVSTTTGSLVKISESDKGFQVNLQKAGDAASNGPPVSSPSPVTFAAASSNDTKQPPAGGALLFTSSTSVPNSTSTSTSTSATTTGSIFGFATKPSSAEIDPRSGSSSSSYSTVSSFAAASTGSSTFGLGSSVSYSTENKLQDSLFASAASKPLVLGAATVSQSTSVQLVSSAPLPSFTTNGSTSFGSSLSNSQELNPNNTFGFSSSASSSDTSAVIPAGVPTPSVVKFGVNSTAVSEVTAVSSSSGATPGIFSFGFSSSSSSNAVGSSAGATLPIFSFSGSSVPLGSGGGDKSGRKIVKNKNRKK